MRSDSQVSVRKIMSLLCISTKRFNNGSLGSKLRHLMTAKDRDTLPERRGEEEKGGQPIDLSRYEELVKSQW